MEKMCYHMRSIGNESALSFKALLDNLVDKNKLGVEFDEHDWSRFREAVVGPRSHYDEPEYNKASPSRGNVRLPDSQLHIRDYLTFKPWK
jgi:hypothetical protein